MASVFTMIINGDIPGHFVWRDDDAVAFLSINPINVGHTLVVPRDEVDHWLDLPSASASHLMEVAHHVGAAHQRVFAAKRVGLIIAGFEVAHTHLHVLPISSMAHMDFANAATDVDHAELATNASMIRDALSAAGHDEASGA